MYTRFELYLEGEPQNVGFMVGLNELALPNERLDCVMEEFNRNLPFPIIPEQYRKQTPLSYFTEVGLERFYAAIQNLLDIYEDYNFFDIVKLETTLSDKLIIYRDEYQVIAV